MTTTMITAESPRFIAVEGLDGCGKSTFARQLAVALGADLLQTPLNLDPAVRTAMEAHCARSPLARMMFYGATVVAAAVVIRDALATGRSVVVDRYWLSTVVYHRVMGSACALDEIADVLPIPDFTAFLHAPLEVRSQRIRGRGLTTEADRWSLQPEPSARIEALYRELGRRPIAGRFVELDTSERTPGELVSAFSRLSIKS